MRPILSLAVVLLAGCAAYTGRGLVPGQSTEADVLAVMGKPTERDPAPKPGETVLWYSRLPYGRENWAAVIGPDGRLVSLEQRLTVENLDNLHRNQTTAAQVRELFGPPNKVSEFPRMNREIWTYQMPATEEWKVLLVQFSPDHVLREYYYMDDPEIPRLPAGTFRR